MTELDDLLALHEAEGRFTADVHRGWAIGGAVNGGVVLALLGRALERSIGTAGHPHPLAMSAYFLSPTRPGQVQIETSTVREGRTMATGQASLLQAGGSVEDGGPAEDASPVERVRALATYGDLGSLTTEVRTSAEPPVMPPPEQCISARDGGASEASEFVQRFDMRLDPATIGWALGEPSRKGLIQAWLKTTDDRAPDPLMLLLAVDALPPVAFDLGLPGWAPTLELSAHVRAAPAPGWLRVKVSSRNLAGGLFEEDAEVWDSTDRLVAQSRQLARIPTPPTR